MPIYEFTCSVCGLRSEHLFRRVSDQATMPCPECGEEAKRVVSAASFKFAHGESQLRGMAPPNTGTSDDWNYDRIIGRDADRRRRLTDERRKYKEGVIRQERKAGRDVRMENLQKTLDGDYRVLPEEGRGVINRARALHKQATDIIDSHKAAGTPASLDKEAG